MNIEEYRKHTVTMTFPSGLCLSVRPPSVRALMTIASGSDEPVVMQAKMLTEVEKGFPDGATLDDITEPKDWAYLLEWLNGFFLQAAPGSLPASKPSCEIVSLAQDSGPTIS